MSPAELIHALHAVSALGTKITVTSTWAEYPQHPTHMLTFGGTAFDIEERLRRHIRDDPKIVCQFRKRPGWYGEI